MPNKDISGVFYDSRKVTPGGLFVAISGFRRDGHDFLEAAIGRGAAAVALEKNYAAKNPQKVQELKKKYPQVELLEVDDGREALAELSAGFYGRPSQKLKLAGVTGTNGKTTVTYLLQSIFRQGGDKGAVIGTLAVRIGDEVLPTEHTTPESSDLQGLLARMVEAKVGLVALEVSSHALALKRTLGCRFAVRILTNITGDHLDFHKTFEEYAAVKAAFLKEPAAVPTVLNLDDKTGRETAEYLKKKGAPVLTYALEDAKADLRAENIKLTPEGTSFELILDKGASSSLSLKDQTPAEKVMIKFPLLGLFNVANALAAAGAALMLGFSLEQIARGLAAAQVVPGRLERISESQEFSLVVDYAHTPDGIKQVLRAVRPMTKGRVIIVFGCGGDRDRTKRPKMGYIAGRLSDWVIITSDNPRSEDPVAIIQEIEDGVRAAISVERHGRASSLFPNLDIELEEGLEKVYLNRGFTIEPDRELAISEALALARPGDLVLIAGKGHETEQIFKDRTVHFDDREVARRLLRQKTDEAGRP